MRRRLPAALVALALLGGAGCSSDGSEPSAAPDDSTTTEATSTTVAAEVEPLEDQTAPPSINGLTVDGDTLWIASINGDEVLQVRIEDGAILQRFATGGAGPDDVDLAPDGSVWTTGFTGGQLGRTADGTYEVVTTLPVGINPVAVDDDGIVWVGTYGPDGELYRIDPEALDDAPEPVATDLPDINAFDFLPDGRLLAPAGGLTGPSGAIAIDVVTGEYETLVQGLPPVAAGTVDAEGTGYLLANVTGGLLRIDVEAGTSEEVRTVTGAGPYDNLAFADDGTLYLSSFVEPVVVEVRPDGTQRTIAIGT